MHTSECAEAVARHGERAFLAVNWLKPSALLRALEQGYAVMVAGSGCWLGRLRQCRAGCWAKGCGGAMRMGCL